MKQEQKCQICNLNKVECIVKDEFICGNSRGELKWLN